MSSNSSKEMLIPVIIDLPGVLKRCTNKDKDIIAIYCKNFTLEENLLSYQEINSRIQKSANPVTEKKLRYIRDLLLISINKRSLIKN